MKLVSRAFRIALFPLLAVLGGGCVTAHYRYSITVPGASHDNPAKVEISWKGGGKTLTVQDSNVATARITEVMQPALCPDADIPRGLAIRVTRPGFKPLEMVYTQVDDDFRMRRWDSFYRNDVVELAPDNTCAESRAIDGTSLYR